MFHAASFVAPPALWRRQLCGAASFVAHSSPAFCAGGFWSSREIEGWGAGIRLLGQWGFFDQPEPRMQRYRWAAPLFHLLKPIRIFHYRLGDGSS